MDDRLNTKECAEIANVHPRTIVTWIRRGWLAATKLPGSRGQYRIRRSDLENLISNSYKPTEEDLY